MENEKKVKADPKDHLANERTFLAWIRTCLGLMAFGFVIERTSLLIKEIDPTRTAYYGSLFGIILVLIGLLLTPLSWFNYRQVRKQLDSHTYYPASFLSVVLTIFVIVIAIFLLLYL